MPQLFTRRDIAQLAVDDPIAIACVGSCWCIMLVAASAAPDQQLLWCAGLTAVIATERMGQRPRRATRITAALLFIAAILLFSRQ